MALKYVTVNTSTNVVSEQKDFTGTINENDFTLAYYLPGETLWANVEGEPS